MIINLEFDAAAQAAPASFRSTLQEAADIIESMFSDNITINLEIQYNEDGIGAGSAYAGPSDGEYIGYSSVYNYLVGSASPGDSSFDFLPAPGSAGAPSEVAVWDAQLKAMGLISPTGSEVDGEANFSASISSSLLLGVALHELTHAMGRVPYGEPDSAYPDIFDFDRFSSQGTILVNDSVPASAQAYFSLNGGASAWADYGIYSDPSDYLNSYAYNGDAASNLSVEDAFNQYYDNNTLQRLTPLDLEQMDMLGFHLKSDAPVEDAYDFNGGNSGDILLQNASGQIEYANMEGGSFQGFVNVANVPGWTVVGEGQISGGVDSDIVLQNATGGLIYADLKNGVLSNYVGVSGAPGYNVVGVGDITDDHYDDIVIQNPTTADIQYANMDNGVFNGWVNISSVPGWRVVAVADINDSGYDDIVIQNTTGGIIYANMTGGSFQGWVGVTGTPGYNVVGAGDIQRDGYDDIVIQNPTSGSIEYANMNNGVFNSWNSLGSVPGWNVVAVEDILGNGYDDIVIQNASTGQLMYANMTGGSFQGWVGITSAPGFTGSSAPGAVESIESSSNGPLEPQSAVLAYNEQNAEWSNSYGNGADTAPGQTPAIGTPTGPLLDQLPGPMGGSGAAASNMWMQNAADLGNGFASLFSGPETMAPGGNGAWQAWEGGSSASENIATNNGGGSWANHWSGVWQNWLSEGAQLGWTSPTFPEQAAASSGTGFANTSAGTFAVPATQNTLHPGMAT
jgi:hypothetical protein